MIVLLRECDPHTANLRNPIPRREVKGKFLICPLPLQHLLHLYVYFTMKITCGLLIALVFWGCHNKGNTPDVSGIKVDLKLERFEKSFFRIDSGNIAQGL